MIRSEQGYQKAIAKLQQDARVLQAQQQQLGELGLEGEELDLAMQPLRSFHEQLKEEVEVYERMKRGDLGVLYSLNSIGRWLIGIRIAKGMTQSELAERLGVSPPQVSRDETNEYYGISVDRAQRILEALDVRFHAELDDPIVNQPDHGELVPA